MLARRPLCVKTAASTNGLKMLVYNRGGPTVSSYAARAKHLKEMEHQNDARISAGFRGKFGGRNTSGFGFSGFDLFVSGMVQHLSLQKDRARFAASMHEPVHGGLSLGRA